MKKFKALCKNIIDDLNKDLCGNKTTGFEIPQFDGSLTEYSKSVISGVDPKLDKNKQNRVDCPNQS